MNEDKNLNVNPKKPNISANGNIEWSSSDNNFNFNNIRYRKNLFWSKQMAHHKLNWYKAKKYCNNLSIRNSGVLFNNFRLPTSDEFWYSFKTGYYVSEDLPSNMKRKSFFTNTVSKTYKNNIIVIDVGSSNVEVRDHTKKNSRYIGSFSQHRIYVMCTSDKISGSVQNIAKNMFEKFEENSSKLSLPKKPIKMRYKKLLKDEFETTKQYNSRINESKKSIDLQNKKKIKSWKQKIENQKLKYKSKLKRLKNSRKSDYIRYLQKAMHIKYGSPKIINVEYNADNQIFEIKLKSTRDGYNNKVKIPVKIKYAKKFKKILEDKNFKPTIEFKVVNNKLIFSGIKEIKDPEVLVEENEYKKAYKIKNNKNSISELQKFIAKYPNSTFKSSAESRITNLKKEIRVEKEKERLYKIRRAEEDRKTKEKWKKERERKQQSYYAKKYVGEKVCKDGTTALILSITITAYVERVNGNNIQLRISDTEGTTPNFNGVTLYRNTLIWDDYSSWYKCNY